MGEDLQPFDTAAHLTHPEDLRALIVDAFATDDQTAIIDAIGIAARACRIPVEGSSVTLDTLLKVVGSLDLRVTILPS